MNKSASVTSYQNFNKNSILGSGIQKSFNDEDIKKLKTSFIIEK